MNPFETDDAVPPCDGANALNRRSFMKAVGLGTVGLATVPGTVMAGPFTAEDMSNWIPADKKLDPEWVKSLFARGESSVYRGSDLTYIGMPVGGICCGQLYLGGDGRLWHWDIFNQRIKTEPKGDHYVRPLEQHAPLAQHFSLSIGEHVHRLDQSGFPDVRFTGQYPIGTVDYRKPSLPVSVTLDAFSPFIPLATDDSSLPATVLQFTVRNTSQTVIETTLCGTLENAICLDHRSHSGTRRNRITKGDTFSLLECLADSCMGSDVTDRPDIPFEKWDHATYAGWTVEGTAFGSGPILRSEMPDYMGHVVGGDTQRLANTHACASGDDRIVRDAATGKLTSSTFAIERDFIHFWIGGGNHAGETCLNLIVDGQVVHSAAGPRSNTMTTHTFDVRALAGKQAHIEIIDTHTGDWGHIGVGEIKFTDLNIGPDLSHLHDYGSMCLMLLGSPADVAAAGNTGPADSAHAPLAEKLVGSLGRTLTLAPAQSETVSFVITWRFANRSIGRRRFPNIGHSYATRFDSASAVARHIAANFERLTTQTRLWRDTWYDSSLPYWFLDRSFLNVSTLASSTCHRFRSGRFWAWEGVGCCHGTCTHVWHYAQAVARLFPELERDLRERTDFGTAIDTATGVIHYRGEEGQLAIDGQAGCILRAYREHLMCPDDAFLRRNWPGIRKATQCLIDHDPDGNGILDGAQQNTLDAKWHGRIAWLSSLYVAALRAAEAMALTMGDAAFGKRARALADAGGTNIDEELFNGEYYVQIPDPDHANTVGSYDGCQIDQVLGQSWAWQVGLERVLPEGHVKTALASLWTYNFAPDVGPYRDAHKEGRWYAVAGEAGLLMCSWPKGDAARVSGGYDYYLNECMTGFEYQVAGHMIWEGMLMEGLAITRAIHDRYHPSRRNPWNEVECGDHYARAMASYGVFLAACGFEYHGPQGHIGFAPRVGADDFKAPFTSAEGWGTYQQRIEAQSMTATISPKWGRLALRSLSFEARDGSRIISVTLHVTGQKRACEWTQSGRRVTLTLTEAITLDADQMLRVTLSA